MSAARRGWLELVEECDVRAAATRTSAIELSSTSRDDGAARTPRDSSERVSVHEGDVSLGDRMQSLLDRRLPLRTRLDLLVADMRRKMSSTRDAYSVRYGPAHVFLSEADFAVDRASFTFAVTEANYATEYTGVVVLDIGSHKGYYAAYATTSGARAVIAYEPERVNFDVLERTAAGYRGDARSWTLHRAAVDATAGRAHLHVMKGSWGHTLRPPRAFAEHEVGLEAVDVVALAEVLQEASLRAGEGRLVVKLNIEGAECSAVLDTPAAAWESVDEVFVETHAWAACDAVQLAEHLEASGLTRVESSHPAVLRMRRREAARCGRRTGPR